MDKHVKHNVALTVASCPMSASMYSQLLNAAARRGPRRAGA